MRVIKNRLFLRAAEEAGHPELSGLLTGPTAVIFGYEDIAAAARTVTEYMRTARNAFAVRSGMLDGQMLSLADLQGLASLPTRPVLLGMVAGALQGPVANLARLLGNVLSNPPGRLLNDSVQTFNGLLEARAKQLEAA
jgi:large subunit ribosomal protein L10